MADADKCAFCGEIISEGNSKNPYYNSEGYADPTVGACGKE